jgi:hypothetical protein
MTLISKRHSSTTFHYEYYHFWDDHHATILTAFRY